MKRKERGKEERKKVQDKEYMNQAITYKPRTWMMR